MTDVRREDSEMSHTEDGMTVHKRDTVSEVHDTGVQPGDRDVTMETTTVQPAGAVRETTVYTQGQPVQPAVSTHHSESVTADPYAPRRQNAYRLQQLIYLVFGVIEGLIAFRFILSLLGANARSGFGQFIYGITDVFMGPFIGLFGTPNVAGSVFEWNALVAIVFYGLVAWLLARVVWLTIGTDRHAVRTSTHHIDNDRQ